MSYVDAWNSVRDKRIAALASYGIKAEPGKYLGYIGISAGETCKLLRMLGELKRLQRLNESLAERIAAQSELLTRRSEKHPSPPSPAAGMGWGGGKNEMKISALAPWYGSKRTLAPEIVRQLGEHRAYWEPFCGSM